MYRKFNFTEDEVLDAIDAYRADTGWNTPCCLDMLKDACECDTLEDAVNTLVLDSEFWEGEFWEGNFP